MAKYYLSFQHDHELCIEGSSEEEYHRLVNRDGSKLTDKQQADLFDALDESENEYYKFISEQGMKWIDVLNNKTGEVLVIRVDKKGKTKFGDHIIAPMSDFMEHHRERIKAPKGYLSRRKKEKVKQQAAKPNYSNLNMEFHPL